MQVATVLTLATPAQALGALRVALPSGFPWIGVCLIAAQSGVETADWRSMHNWNLGNVTPTATQASQGQWMDQHITGMKYISYPNILAGARGMVGWLSPRGLLAPASQADLGTYMSLLRAKCYLGCIGNTDPTGHTVSQDDYDNYAAGISGRIRHLQGIAPEVPPVWDYLPPGSAYLAAGLGFLGAVAFAAHRHGRL